MWIEVIRVDLLHEFPHALSSASCSVFALFPRRLYEEEHKSK